jgi:hypothetical protein
LDSLFSLSLSLFYIFSQFFLLMNTFFFMNKSPFHTAGESIGQGPLCQASVLYCVRRRRHPNLRSLSYRTTPYHNAIPARLKSLHQGVYHRLDGGNLTGGGATPPLVLTTGADDRSPTAARVGLTTIIGRVRVGVGATGLVGVEAIVHDLAADRDTESLVVPHLLIGQGRVAERHLRTVRISHLLLEKADKACKSGTACGDVDCDRRAATCGTRVIEYSCFRNYSTCHIIYYIKLSLYIYYCH